MRRRSNLAGCKVKIKKDEETKSGKLKSQKLARERDQIKHVAKLKSSKMKRSNPAGCKVKINQEEEIKSSMLQSLNQSRGRDLI